MPMLRQIDIFQGALVKLSNYAFIAKRSKRLDDQPDNALAQVCPSRQLLKFVQRIRQSASGNRVKLELEENLLS